MYFLLLYVFNHHPRTFSIVFREREEVGQREREREMKRTRQKGISMREREVWMPEKIIGWLPLRRLGSQTEIEPTTQACDLTANRTHKFWCMGRCSNQTSHTRRGSLQCIFIYEYSSLPDGFFIFKYFVFISLKLNIYHYY